MAFAAPVEPVVLEGRHVRLEPLVPDHLDGLAAIGLDPDLWRWASHVYDRASLERYVERALAEREAGVSLPFATVERSTGRIAGSTRFGNISAENRRVEIGWTWLGKPFQRTALNTEAKLLMLGHAFETWRCIRVELKTDALNEPSRAAILRIGARFEGILRSHMVMETGRVRDTAYFSVLEAEWPEVKAELIARLEARRG